MSHRTKENPYGDGPIQTRSDCMYGSDYAGCYYWEMVTEAYTAWLADDTIFRITWWEREGKVVDYDFKKIKEEKGKWRHRCFVPLTKKQLSKWSSESLRDVFQVFPKFAEVKPDTSMFVDQDLYNVIPNTKHHPIHEVLTEDQFLRRYCRGYYDKMMYEREQKQFSHEAQEFLEREEARKEKVREETRIRREAKEAERMEAEQKANKGEKEKPKEEEKKKKHRGKRGGKLRKRKEAA